MLRNTIVRIADLAKCPVNLILAFALASASSIPGQAATPKGDGGTCVGVISAIGDALTLTKMGFTVFNNEQNKVSIEPWRIDDVVFGKITAALGKRVTLKRVSFPTGSFALLEQDHNPFYNPVEDIGAILRKITSSTKCSQYLVVVKTSLVLQDSHQRIDGLGIERVGKYFLHALFTVHLYDGQNFSSLAQYKPSIGRNFLGVNMMPMREVDETWWPVIDVVQNSKLRDGIRALVEQGMDGALQQLLQAQ
jgi:hypothetical protein